MVATNRSSASYVSLRYGFDGENFHEFFRKSDGGFPFDKQVLHTVDEAEVPTKTRRTYLQCAFFCRGGAATYGMDGIQDLWIRAQHEPRDSRFEPLEVTYNWTEHRASGDMTRSHTELIDSLPHEYVINTAGFRDPTMNWVRMNLSGYGPPNSNSTYGYSDGQDVGLAFEHRAVTYVWGTNLAKEKLYSTSRPSSSASKNPDTDGRELTNGVIIAPTDLTASDKVQAATAFWAGDEPVVFVVDMGDSTDSGRCSNQQSSTQRRLLPSPASRRCRIGEWGGLARSRHDLPRRSLETSGGLRALGARRRSELRSPLRRRSTGLHLSARSRHTSRWALRAFHLHPVGRERRGAFRTAGVRSSERDSVAVDNQRANRQEL